jgi:hypothetical protein
MQGYYYKNKKLYTYELTEAEALEALALRRKQLKARAMAEKKAQEEYKKEHVNGYCPHCFLLIPIGGQCECGGE